MLAPPSELLQKCKPARVENNKVKTLVAANIINTTEIYKCNNRLDAIGEWYKQQAAVGEKEIKE